MQDIQALDLIEIYLARNNDISPLELHNTPLYCASVYLVLEIIRQNLNVASLEEADIHTYAPAFALDITNLDSPVLYCNTLQYLQDKWSLCANGEASAIEVEITQESGEVLKFPFKKEMIYVEGDILTYIANRVQQLAGEEGLAFFKKQLEKDASDPEIETLKQQIKDICKGDE